MYQSVEESTVKGTTTPHTVYTPSSRSEGSQIGTGWRVRGSLLCLPLGYTLISPKAPRDDHLPLVFGRRVYCK